MNGDFHHCVDYKKLSAIFSILFCCAEVALASCFSDHGSKSFDSEGGWWKPGTMYIISVTVEVGSLSSVTTSRMLLTNLEPYNGTCHVDPQEG